MFLRAAISDDEEDDAPRTRSKWSTPVVQKQRVAYMDNLNLKVRSRETYETDQFNERLIDLNIYFQLNCFVCRRWNKASSELQSHVISSRSRKANTSRNTAASVAASIPPSSPSGSIFGALGDKVSRIFSGTPKEDASERRLVVPSTTSRNSSKRNYGFATSNLSHFSDQHSEDLYRYKNISSDYMRETSPTRENNLPAIASGSNPFAAERNDNDDQPPIASRIRRPVARRYNDDDQPVTALSTGPFVAKQNDDDDQPVTAPSTGHFVVKQNDDNNDGNQ